MTEPEDTTSLEDFASEPAEEEIDVIAHSDDDEEVGACCIINGSSKF